MLMLRAKEDNPYMNENPTNSDDPSTPAAADTSVNPQNSSENGETIQVNVNNSDSSTQAESSPETTTTSPETSTDSPAEVQSQTEPAADQPSVDQPAPEAPVESFPVSDAVSTPEQTQNTATTDNAAPQTPKPVVGPKGYKMKRFLKGALLVVVVASLVGGAFVLGKNHQKVVIQAPAAQPVNLPPQAVVLTACVQGRGKQYVIPKDIPNGPIYDEEL